MTGLVTPVVQVVASGTDWPAIVASIATGVVGLAGIIATYLQGNRASRAEDRRAEIAEKRRIYAQCQNALNIASFSAIRARELKESPSPEQRIKDAEDLNANLVTAGGATFAVILIGSRDVIPLAEEVRDLLPLVTIEAEAVTQLGGKMGALLKAMRVDLDKSNLEVSDPRGN
jgi:hypothetical protein